MIDSDSRIRNASRRVGLDTPNRAISTDSVGSGSPGLSAPVMICRRRSAATSSPALGTRTMDDRSMVICPSPSLSDRPESQVVHTIPEIDPFGSNQLNF